MRRKELVQPLGNQSVVTLYFPGGREHLWLDGDSPLVQWRVGQVVHFRDRSWIVRSRAEEEKSLRFSLGVET